MCGTLSDLSRSAPFYCLLKLQQHSSRASVEYHRSLVEHYIGPTSVHLHELTLCITVTKWVSPVTLAEQSHHVLRIGDVSYRWLVSFFAPLCAFALICQSLISLEGWESHISSLPHLKIENTVSVIGMFAIYYLL